MAIYALNHDYDIVEKMTGTYENNTYMSALAGPDPLRLAWWTG